MKSILALLLLTGALTHAAVTPPSAPPDVVKRTADKSVGKAYGYMLLGTAGPILVGAGMASQGGEIAGSIGLWSIFGGMLIGPSTGQFYAESYRTGLFSASLRVGAVALPLGMLLFEFPVNNTAGLALYGLSVGAMMAGNVHSLIDTRSAVVRYRNRHRPTGHRFGLTPTFTPADGELRPGAMAWMRF